MKKHNRPEFKNNRKSLRKKLTPAEAYLWKQIQHKKLEGRKFRRQHSVNRYIVDFYCASEKLIIELDGQVHLNYTAAAKDEKRDSYLTNLGFKVLRFENRMVFENLSSVLQEITEHFK
ncbi:endonuclease domain-containing protein [Croceitalea rosinachiae]|uniref:Endonuclease domain-containing protein n=1 Tax=Croceitalea rosinachiae TaxID=3075596 RepID=A0ABU3A750_9FLAO|nr:endonuclease domain-containing protein [Croceitalea sp. F388]MDT0605994.1 endonuclease domain-containing protein [Croceitalea sp. F388]